MCFCFFRVLLRSVFLFCLSSSSWVVVFPCCVVVLVFLLHVLAACFCVWALVLSFCGNLVGGSFGYGRPGGVNIFFGFSQNRSVWVRTGTGPQGEGFCERFWRRNYGA